MTTPLDLAQNLARTGKWDAVVEGVAIVTRGLTDDEPEKFKQGWPLNEATVTSACKFLNVDPTSELIAAVIERAPTLSDAILNKPSA